MYKNELVRVRVGGNGSKPDIAVKILFGQELSNFDGILSVSASPSGFTQITDVDATSFTPDGIGSAILYIDGVDKGKVLVLNKNPIHPHFLLSGVTIRSLTTENLNCVDAGGHPATQLVYIPYGV